MSVVVYTIEVQKTRQQLVKQCVRPLALALLRS